MRTIVSLQADEGRAELALLLENTYRQETSCFANGANVAAEIVREEILRHTQEPPRLESPRLERRLLAGQEAIP